MNSWELIRNRRRFLTLPWVYTRDFNDMLGAEDKHETHDHL